MADQPSLDEAEREDRQAPFVYPRLIICEGADDVAFFGRFIKDRNLPFFHIRSTGEDRRSRGGNTKFSLALESIKLNRAFGNLKDIVIVADNDDSPGAGFSQVCDQINEAGYTAPIAPFKKGAGTPSVTVMMLPYDGSQGNLECVLMPAATSADPSVAAMSDHCLAVLRAENWAIPKRGKLWLRINLAARARDPFISLQSALTDPRESKLFRFKGKVLQPIAALLSSFEESPPPANPLSAERAGQSSRKRARTHPGPRMRPLHRRSQ